MFNLSNKQIEIKTKIELISRIFGIDPSWASAVAMVESSLGINQRSPTGALGVFQMTQIAMKDLHLLMRRVDDDLVDIVCGVAFLRLLLSRWKTIEDATNHFCDPNDRPVYFDKVKHFMEMLDNK